MPVPKRRTSKSKRDRRRSHDAMTAPNLIPCPQCGEAKLPHRVCPHCGNYKGRDVIPIEET